MLELVDLVFEREMSGGKERIPQLFSQILAVAIREMCGAARMDDPGSIFSFRFGM